MGLLDNWASRLTGPGPEHRPRPGPPPRPLTAAGSRINLRSPDLIHTRHPEWQSSAWDYRDEVPELRFAGDFITNALGRLRVYPAENRPRGQEPVPLAGDHIPSEVTNSPAITDDTRAACKAAHDRLDLDRHGSSLLARMGENLEFAGECYLLGEMGDEGEQWTIRSVSELVVTQGGARLIEPGHGGGASRELRPEEVELLRLWNPHPRYYDWPDAALAALLTTLEGMVILGRRGRAHDRSRISSGTALFVPDEFSLTRAGSAVDVDEDDDPFMAELAQAMMAPVRDESDPSTVVPVVIRGPGVLGDKYGADMIKTVQLHSEDPKGLDERYEALVQRFARGISLPPEVVKGIGDTNHWNGAVIDAAMVKNHIEPRAERMVDALTAAYFRPALKAMGVPAEQRNRVCLWFDASELVQNPNREQAAKDAHGSGAISDAALREVLGFTEEHKPDDKERLIRTLTDGRAYEASIPWIIGMSGMDLSDPELAQAVRLVRQLGPNAPGGQPARPVIDATPNRTPPPDSPAGVRSAPKTGGPDGPGAVAASAEKPARYRVDETASRRLAQIDRALTDRLVAHAEATVGRAVEKAANRIRGRAQKNPVLAAAFPAGCDPVAVVAASGRDVQGDLSDDALLAGALDELAVRWDRETGHAAEQAAAAVGGMVGKQAAAGLVERLVEGARRGWQWLRGRLERHITRVLYGESDADPVPTQLVRGALTVAGGLSETSPGIGDDGAPVVAPGQPVQPQTGIATGDTTTTAVRDGGAAELGWIWGYHGMARKDPFLPHRALDGRRFAGFDDEGLATGAKDGWIGTHYFPGDHTGCMCSFEMIWATPTGEDWSSSTNRDVTAGVDGWTPEQQRIRDLAAEDDAAGRTGTTAQRDRDTMDELAGLRREHIDKRDGMAKIR